MFKKISFILCASVTFLAPMDAYASDKVLSPVSDWHLSQNGQADNCSLSAHFENDIKLSFDGNHGRITSLSLTDPGAAFAVGEVYEANLMMTPPYNVASNANVTSAGSVNLDTSAAQGFLQKAGGSFLMKIKLLEKEYSFSLMGLKNSMRNLQSCRELASTKPIGLVSFDSEQGTNVVLSEGAGNPKLSAYPLGNGPKNDVQDSFEQPVVMAEPAQSISLETETAKEQSIQAPKQVVPEQTEVVAGDAYSITRIHKPGAKIQPSEEAAPVVQAEPMKTTKSIASTEDLSQPPAFDTSSVPIPADDTLSDQPLQRLASINDKQAEIHWNGKNIEGEIDPIMSQSSEQAQRIPVVIPRIDTSDSPRRIDITNQNIARASRNISNQELENQLKNPSAPVFETPTLEPQVQQQTNQPQIQAAAVAPVHNEILASAGQPLWNANSGDSLKEVIANWSIQENVELVWDAADKYTVLKTFVTAEGYEQAIAGLLNQYVVQEYDNRPVGQLYIDPENGEKMLIVQSN